jgi:PTS system N-acetylgalactosamine-specific IIA component
MIGFIVTGHGNFATGMLSAVELVAGKQEQLGGVDFLESDSTKDLKEKLIAAIETMHRECEEIILLTDLKGGSPFNVAAALKVETAQPSLEVICGTNFPLILGGIFEREDISMKDLVKNMIENGQTGIDTFVLAAPQKEILDEEDGI